MTDGAAVVAALRDLLGPDAVVSEPHELTRYEQGWRYGHGKALAAARPGSTGDVSRVLAFAATRGVRVVPQGANTGLVGGSTPDGSGGMLVLSLERLSRKAASSAPTALSATHDTTSVLPSRGSCSQVRSVRRKSAVTGSVGSNRVGRVRIVSRSC